MFLEAVGGPFFSWGGLLTESFGFKMQCFRFVPSTESLTVQFTNVVLSSIGAVIPDEIWSSDEVERRLKPLYERLKLPEGRLELMSGISRRRLWASGTLPSGPSIQSVNAAIDGSSIERSQIGCLIHASVCRDFLEPATATRVHNGARLPCDAWVYDVSNACLGLINGMVQIATMIESGMIGAGVVVGTESSRSLLEQTIVSLNSDMGLTRKSVKSAFASLTIGSGSCAMLLSHRDLAPAATRLETVVAEARTQYHHLCLSDQDSAGANMQPLMETDSEALMEQGIETGVAALERLLTESGLSREDFDRTVCHQVGVRHRVAMLKAMGLPTDRDSVTFPDLGNTGSVALPLTLAAAASRGELRPGNRFAMLGIGSGINSVMWSGTWGETLVHGNIDVLEGSAALER